MPIYLLYESRLNLTIFCLLVLYLFACMDIHTDTVVLTCVCILYASQAPLYLYNNKYHISIMSLVYIKLVTIIAKQRRLSREFRFIFFLFFFFFLSLLSHVGLTRQDRDFKCMVFFLHNDLCNCCNPLIHKIIVIETLVIEYIKV